MKKNIKIIIGGGSTNEKVREYIGADAYYPDAGEAMKKIKELIS